VTRFAARLDCRYYVGEKPCRFGCPCDGCTHYAPQGTRVLVIKLGAMGDVLRTTALLPALRAKYDPCHVTWVVDRSGHDLLRGNPGIDRLLALDLGAVLRLDAERFDVALCLDKEDRAVGLIARVAASAKLGYGIDRATGGLMPLNPEAEYSLCLGISDELKFRINRRTYQDFTFEAVGLQYRGEEYSFVLTGDERACGDRRLAELGVRSGDRLLGLNTGAGPVFATKKWSIEGFTALARLAVARLGARILLLGGPEEAERNRAIAKELGDLGDRVIDTGTDNTLRAFAAIVGRLDLLVTGDTLAMHLGIAQRIPTVAIFGPTCAQEVELYGRGEKVLTAPDCAPCYRAECREASQRCMDEIAPEAVFAAVERWWRRSDRGDA
jgi:heptosyltransferase-2